MRKKKNKKTVADTGYKKVDRKEKKKKEKQEEKRRKKKLSVQQSIAYKEMGRDGICRVQGKTYSKCIRFYDINYQLAQNEDKNAIFENWCDFLNYFDASIHFQLSFINHKSSMKEFEQVIRIRPQDDAFDDVRMEYAKMLKQQLAKGNNGLVKSKYITFSIEADNIREAKPKLERIESDILNNFKILGVPAYPLNGVERLQILYETFNPDNMTDFQFDYGSMIRTGLNTKDYVAPTSFVFKDRNTFRMGNTIGAVSYLQILAPELTDKMLAEFLDIDKNLIVNLHVQSVDQMKAIKLVKSKVTDINRMKIEEQKKAVRSGYDMDIIPSDLNTYGGEAKRLLEDLQSRNERMFLVTALFLNTAKTKQALDNAIFQTAGIAQKYNCVLKRLDYQQEEGLMSSVPLGVNHIPIRRALTTTSTAIFVPFTTQELFMAGESLYYGLNALSNNMIMVDRKKLKNPNGLILGTPGSGKSFAAKREITNAFFVTKDDIIIGDPEGEYYPLVHTLMYALSVCEDERLKLAINLSFSCSLRLGELLGLTWDCVDISPEAIEENRAYVFINKESQRIRKESLNALDGKDVMLVFPTNHKKNSTVRILKTPKTESSVRKIFLPKSVANMLVDWKAEQDEMKEILGDEYMDYNLVMASTFGLPLGDGAIRGPLKKLIEDYNLPPVVFHSFRHSSVTYKLKLNGGDIKAVQGDSGHAQVNMVTDVYSHILDDDRRKNAELFEEAFYEKKNLDPQMHVQQENNNATVADEVDPELLAKVLANPEMRALLNSLAKTMK